MPLILSATVDILTGTLGHVELNEWCAHLPDDNLFGFVIGCFTHTFCSGVCGRLHVDEWTLHRRRFCHGDSQQVVPFSLQLACRHSGNLVGHEAQFIGTDYRQTGVQLVQAAEQFEAEILLNLLTYVYWQATEEPGRGNDLF
jgi:hypothetical protein